MSYLVVECNTEDVLCQLSGAVVEDVLLASLHQKRIAVQCKRFLTEGKENNNIGSLDTVAIIILYMVAILICI